MKYKTFFDLFDNFIGYINFFLFQDLIEDNQKVKFYLPFNDFKTPPTFSDIGEYLQYKKGVMSFIKSRNTRISNYSKLNMISRAEIC